MELLRASTRHFGFITIAVLLVPAAWAGAWRLDDGQELTITTVEAFSSEVGARQFEQSVLRSYSEIAIGARSTFGFQLASAWQQASGPGYTNYASGISEAEIFALRHFRRPGGAAFAVRAMGVLGTSKFIDGSRVMGQDAAVAIGALAGHGNERLFGETEVQGRFSVGDDADQLRLNLTGGLKYKRFLLLLQSFNTRSFSSTARGGTDYDLGQISLSAVFPFPRNLSLELGGRQDIYTRNTDPGTTAFFSLWWRV